VKPPKVRLQNTQVTSAEYSTAVKKMVASDNSRSRPFVTERTIAVKGRRTGR
jgi:hypothetical protein